MAKPFWLPYLAKAGEGWKVTPLSENPYHCLTLCLLCIYKPTIALPEYKLKVVNICDMHWTGGI